MEFKLKRVIYISGLKELFSNQYDKLTVKKISDLKNAKKHGYLWRMIKEEI